MCYDIKVHVLDNYSTHFDPLYVVQGPGSFVNATYIKLCTYHVLVVGACTSAKKLQSGAWEQG